VSNTLRPTLLKIALAVLLFLVSSYLWRLYVVSTVTDTFPLGFPFPFYTAWGPCPPGETCSKTNNLFFLLDLLFWYILSGLIVSRIARSKRTR